MVRANPGGTGWRLMYGEPPTELDTVHVEGWDELLHYLYLPIRMSDAGRRDPVRVPPRLAPLLPIVFAVMRDLRDRDELAGRYLYLTARHGYATPDNPLNRPGWHCDGFGTDDVNYVWCDRWPSRYWVRDSFIPSAAFDNVPADHLASMAWFDRHAMGNWRAVAGSLYRLSPFVVHTTPMIPSPGGMRRFVKVSVSRHRYNLIGNSHNYLFDYTWRMWPRSAARNDPAYSQADFVPDEAEPEPTHETHEGAEHGQHQRGGVGR